MTPTIDYQSSVIHTNKTSSLRIHIVHTELGYPLNEVHGAWGIRVVSDVNYDTDKYSRNCNAIIVQQPAYFRCVSYFCKSFSEW